MEFKAIKLHGRYVMVSMHGTKYYVYIQDIDQKNWIYVCEGKTKIKQIDEFCKLVKLHINSDFKNANPSWMYAFGGYEVYTWDQSPYCKPINANTNHEVLKSQFVKNQMVEVFGDERSEVYDALIRPSGSYRVFKVDNFHYFALPEFKDKP